MHTGGCSCRAILYRLAEPLDAVYCHCARCRRHTGAPVAAWAIGHAAQLEVERGQVQSHDGRAFCGACGSSLFALRGDLVEVAIASLDDPVAIAPSIHRCADSQLPWLELADLLPFADGAELPSPDQRRTVRAPADPALGPASTVTLREITRANVRDVVLASVTGPQRKFVATNAISLAQAYLAGDAWHRAICADDTVVGFVMAAILTEDELGLRWKGDANLWRFMIDARYQGRGFGGRALQRVIDELWRWPGVTSIWLSCVKAAGGPYDLYRRFGFEDTGVQDPDGEWILRLARTQQT